MPKITLKPWKSNSKRCTINSLLATLTLQDLYTKFGTKISFASVLTIKVLYKDIGLTIRHLENLDEINE